MILTLNIWDYHIPLSEVYMRFKPFKELMDARHFIKHHKNADPQITKVYNCYVLSQGLLIASFLMILIFTIISIVIWGENSPLKIFSIIIALTAYVVSRFKLWPWFKGNKHKIWKVMQDTQYTGHPSKSNT